MKSVDLPSGSKLEITLSPFEDARALYQAFLKEMKGIKFDPAIDLVTDTNFYKDIACSGFSSKEIEACLWKCMSRATYNGVRITKDTFEPEEARQDYMTVCFEVAKENIVPFTKSLYAQFQTIMGMMSNVQA